LSYSANLSVFDEFNFDLTAEDTEDTEETKERREHKRNPELQLAF